MVLELGIQGDHIDILAAGKQLGIVSESFHDAVLMVKYIVLVQQILFVDGLDRLCGTGIVIDIPTIQKRESGQGQVIGHLEIKVRELQGHILTGLHGIEQVFFAVIPVDPAIGNGVQLPGSVSFGVQQLSMGQLLQGPMGRES